MARPGQRSQDAFTQAKRVIPGGVNSPARSFAGVEGGPAFIERAQGPYIYDIDGHEYVDYVGSFGPAILGHAHPNVIEAVKKQAEKGLSYGAPTAIETELAELIVGMVDSIEQIRMVNSGTEAAMTALRLARGYTGRNKILKFAGCYHGHVDALLVEAGSGALTLGIPGSPGVPEGVTQDTLVAHYNDIDSVKQAFSDYGDDIAAVIVEPVAGNMNCIPPVDGFLQGIRDLCDAHGSVLIFDEVMTGFRVARNCAQSLFGIRPDLTLLGKIVGGGMNVAAVGGRQEIMQSLAPVGPVYQAGTLSGHPMGMACGIATLTELQDDAIYKKIDTQLTKLLDGLTTTAQEYRIPFVTERIGGMFGLFFTAQDQAPSCFDEVADCDGERFKTFFHNFFNAGVYIAPSAFEAGFISVAHDDQAIEKTLSAARQAFASL